MQKSLESALKKVQDFSDDFELLLSQQEKLEYLIELGTKLNQMQSEQCSDANKVYGCVSAVHIDVQEVEDCLQVSFFCEALTIRGMAYIIEHSVQGISTKDFNSVKQKLIDFATKHNLSSGAVVTRANSFGSMLDFIGNQL